MASPDGRMAGAPPQDEEVESLRDLARELRQIIVLHDRQMTSQAQESQAQASRIETMARALTDLRNQNVAVLEETRATMEVATNLIKQSDDQLDRLTEVTLALASIYDQVSETEGEGEGEEQ